MTDYLPRPKAYALALHATSSQLGLAIAHFGGDRRCQTWDLGRDLSKLLATYLADFVKPQSWEDLSFMAVAKGPGSFTSTRIGVVTARTLAQQLEIPLFAISSLAAVAWSQKERWLPEAVLAVQMQARREQVFVAIYHWIEGKLQPLLPDTAMTLQTWQEKLEALGMNYQLIETPDKLGDTVTSVLELAALEWQAGQRPHWSEALPFYGQPPVE
jgi:tRNA threonylcarbamoyl adenosine modification protein YeaZ